MSDTADGTLTEGPTLEVVDLSAGYGALKVIDAISMSVGREEAVGILGANGAGKTTLLRAIAGVIRPTAGTVTFQGKRVDGQPDYVLARAGIGHVPSGRELFPELSVDDNLLLGAYKVGRPRAEELRTRVLELFPVLGTMGGRHAGSLSGGQQQMLAVGRALMTDPQLLLLDEPSTGLAPTIVAQLFEALQRLIHEYRMSVIVVEQNVSLALRLAARGYVIQHGRCVMSGTSEELKTSGLASAYLA
ncbi:MAG: ABC transporter ATP-binding protein [Candidatus Dormibacteria bacterium]